MTHLITIYYPRLSHLLYSLCSFRRGSILVFTTSRSSAGRLLSDMTFAGSCQGHRTVGHVTLSRTGERLHLFTFVCTCCSLFDLHLYIRTSSLHCKVLFSFVILGSPLLLSTQREQGQARATLETLSKMLSPPTPDIYWATRLPQNIWGENTWRAQFINWLHRHSSLDGSTRPSWTGTNYRKWSSETWQSSGLIARW